ncbi:hypothetical protein HYV82_00460 [Candidatus Woesearchaeota archaeon]|nr:hypothetical protein [Candidatus Woesearchaeota archaeon]
MTRITLESIADEHLLLDDVQLGAGEYAILVGSGEDFYITGTDGSAAVLTLDGPLPGQTYSLDAIIVSLQGEQSALAVLENGNGSAYLTVILGTFYYTSDDCGGVPVQLEARKRHTLSEGSILSLNEPYTSAAQQVAAWRVGKYQTT